MRLIPSGHSTEYTIVVPLKDNGDVDIDEIEELVLESCPDRPWINFSNDEIRIDIYADNVTIVDDVKAMLKNAKAFEYYQSLEIVVEPIGDLSLNEIVIVEDTHSPTLRLLTFLYSLKRDAKKYGGEASVEIGDKKLVVRYKGNGIVDFEGEYIIPLGDNFPYDQLSIKVSITEVNDGLYLEFPRE